MIIIIKGKLFKLLNKKVFPNLFKDGIEGMGFCPVKINFNKDF